MNHVINQQKLTFFENIFCKEKPSVATSALMSPMISNEISVTDATMTPPMMGSRDTYTWKKHKNNVQLCYILPL